MIREIAARKQRDAHGLERVRRLEGLGRAALNYEVHAPHKSADGRKRRKRGGLYSGKIFCPFKELAVKTADLLGGDKTSHSVGWVVGWKKGLGCGLEKSRLPNEREASPSRGNCFDRANPRP